MKRWMKLISVTLLAVLALTAFGTATVTNAQGTTPDTTQATRLLAAALLRESAKALNLKPADILKELRDGKTLAEVIKAHNGDQAAIKTAVKTTVTDRIKQAVTNKRMTQEQADKLLAQLDTVLDKLLTTKWPGTDRLTPAERRVQAAGLAALVKETAKQSNVPQRDLLKEMRAGKTLAEIAKAHNADPAKIVTAAVTTVTEQINKQVTNNKLKKEDADKLIAGLQDGLTKLMNTANPLKGNQPARNPRRIMPVTEPAA